MAWLAGLAVLSYVGVKGYGYHEKVKGRAEGVATVIKESIVEGGKINAKTKKDRSAVKPGTAPSELLKRYCRDCK